MVRHKPHNAVDLLNISLKAVFIMPIILYFALCLLSPAYAQDDIMGLIEQRNKALEEKEGLLKKEEERLSLVKKEIEEGIAKYTKILSQIEELLGKIEAYRNERLENLVKTYEAMPNDAAAQKLSTIDELTAIKIISRLKNKKAAGIMALMETQKAAAITQGIINIEKKFPVR